MSSDSEFVQRLRRSPEEVRQIRWVGGITVVLTLGVTIWIFTWCQLPGSGPFLSHERFSLRELMSYALSLGCGGILIGWKLSHLNDMFWDTFGTDRRTELLIRYHDLLAQHNLLPDSPTTANN